MHNPFRFLSDEEWNALRAHAERKRFASDEVLLEEGGTPTGLVVVADGKVGVYRSPAGFRLLISEQGPGAIFGEMSFIESEPADVSVVALTDVDALYLTHERLTEAIKKNPALFGRFFQSLAWILSRRLRETTGKVGPGSGDSWLGD